MSERLRFLFTIDTEISFGDALDDPSLSPVGADRNIWARTEDGEFGINAFMDVFDQYGMRGVFFFEPMGVRLVQGERTLPYSSGSDVLLVTRS